MFAVFAADAHAAVPNQWLDFRKGGQYYRKDRRTTLSVKYIVLSDLVSYVSVHLKTIYGIKSCTWVVEPEFLFNYYFES